MDKIIPFAHKLLKEVITDNDIAVDLTAGKGNDTLFLAKIAKYVYSFDIQEKAIAYSKKLTKKYPNIKYICDNHANLLNYLNTKIKGAIFNLGYLPGENKEVTTKVKTTLKAVNAILNILECGGRCVIVVYSGHYEGFKEAQALEKYLRTLSQKEFAIIKYQFINQINNPPFLLAVERILL